MSLRSLCVYALICSAPVVAQEFRAGIAGIVRDSQGAVIPGVTIEARKIATNDISRTTTNESGYYAFPVLPIGTYRLTAAPAGFKKAVRDNLELRVGDQVQQDFTLEVGAVTESVTVSAGVELLETTGSDKGQVVGEKEVQDTPSVGRNPFLLGIEATGVQFDIGANALSRSVRPFDAGNNVAESMSINGGQTGRSDLLLDGLSDTGVETGSSATNMAFVPNQDAVQEFRIQNSNYDAQYGRTSGGTISLITKGGTNRVHGAAYWYNKNTVLTANTFDQNRLGNGRAAYHQNEPGVELDGPVVIPHLYDGHNKTFFMYSYELWRDAIPSPATSTTPQPAALQGNFNTTLQSNGQPVIVYDPNTTAQTGTNTYTRTPFPGDIIPSSRFNPVGAKIVSYIPAPNVPGQTNNLVVAPNARTDAYDAHIARVDQQLSEKERLFGRFDRGFRTEVNDTNGFPKVASPQYTDGRLSQGGGVDLTSILSPSTVLTSRVGYLRHDLWITLYTSGFDPTTLGFPSSLLETLPPYFPAIQPSGYTSFGSGRSFGNQFTESASWSWSEIVNKTIRRHQVKFGGEFRAMLDNINSPTTNFGSYSFSATPTQQNALTGSAAAGNSIASLLLGLATGGSAPINAALAYGFHYYGTFVQDDWRVTGKLTLSMGLRWDYESPVTERNNQQNAGFDRNATSPLQVADPYQPGATLQGGLLFEGPNSRLPYGRDLNNLQPRVGFAWHPTEKTVIRGGFGISYFATFTPAGNQGFSTSTPYVWSSDNIYSNGTTLSNPYPQGILTPTGSKLGLATFLGQSVSFVDPNRVIPKVEQFSIGVQRQLPGRAVLEISYVGSRSNSMDVSQNLNAVSTAQLLEYGGNASPNLTNSVPNPFSGLLPSTSINGATTTLQQLLLPFPQFTGVTETNIPVGKSWYNSLQVRFDKRLTHGLNFMVSYTRSKWLDSLSYLNAQEAITQTPERTLDATDTPNRIVLSGNWQLPIFAHTHGVAGVFLHGWQLNGIFMRENGFPLTAPAGYYSAGIDPSLHDPLDQQYFDTCTLLTNGTTNNCKNLKTGGTLPIAFLQQLPNTLRTLSGRFPTIRPPKVPNADVSLFKAFTLRETVRLQFRAEAFNFTNSPQFNTPSTSLTSTSAGVVTLTQVNDPRNIQLSLRLMF
ncbi:MAG TPA: TonB-dependent receptor [Bryobacteraceae bacterium]|nr:TonB-dependent receptor [Bryobacteraceae bacterium]